MATKFVLPFRNPAIWELMGIEVTEMKDGHATLIMPFHEKLTQPYGIVHGGALFTLADSAAAVAIASVVNPRENRLLTIEMKMNFLASVSEGTMEARIQLQVL